MVDQAFLRQRAELDRNASQGRWRLEPREFEQLLHQVLQAIDTLAQLSERGLALRGACRACGVVGLQPHGGQRRAQLVRCVGDELPVLREA